VVCLGLHEESIVVNNTEIVAIKIRFAGFMAKFVTSFAGWRHAKGESSFPVAEKTDAINDLMDDYFLVLWLSCKFIHSKTGLSISQRLPDCRIQRWQFGGRRENFPSRP
jgi:hypothetical protein